MKRAEKIFAFLFIAVSSSGWAQDPCGTCISKISTDPASPVVHFTQIATEDPRHGDASEKAKWCLCKLVLELCECPSDNDKEALKSYLEAAEENLRKMGSSLPIAEYNEYKSQFKPTTAGTGYNAGSQFKPTTAGAGYNAGGASNQVRKISKWAGPVGYRKPSSAKSDDVKSEDEKTSKLKNGIVAEKKQQAAAEKRVIRNRSSSLVQAAKKNDCTETGLSVIMTNTPESGLLNSNSLNGAMSWSIWKEIPGTSLEIRFSKKKVCAEPEFPNTTDREKNLQYVLEGADQFFDYGFLQLRNRSNQTVSGQLFLVTQGDNTTHSEDWPFYLEPGKTGEESIGNWYMGCEISSVTVKRYCK